MSLLNFIDKNDLRSKWIDLSFVGTPGTYYDTLDDSLSAINNESNSKATYIKGNLLMPWFWQSSSTTINGITATFDWATNTITVNGTATDDVTMTLVPSGLPPYSTKVFSEKEYKLSGCPSGSTSTYWLSIEGITNGGNDTGNGFYFTPSSTTTVGVSLHIANGTTMDKAVFKPALEICSSSETKSAFEAFGEKMNRNLVDMNSLFSGTPELTFQDDGSVTGFSNPFSGKSYTVPSSLIGSTITASAKIKHLDSSSSSITIDIVGSNGVKARSYSVTGQNTTYIWVSATIEEGDYIRIQSPDNSLINVSEYQVELGAKPTTYKVYQEISSNQDYVSVVRMVKDATRNETQTVTSYPDNLIIDLNGHKLSGSTKVGMNNGNKINSICIYGMKSGSGITLSDYIVIYARNKETYLLGGTYESTYKSTSEHMQILYNIGKKYSSYGGDEFQDSRTEVVNAVFKATSDIENSDTMAHQGLLIQQIDVTIIENTTIEMSTAFGTIGIDYYGIPESGIDSLYIRNSTIDISSTTTTKGHAVYGIQFQAGNPGKGTASYEIRDCFIRAVSPDHADGSSLGVRSYMKSANYDVKNYIINSEIYGCAQGVQIDNNKCYIKNCILGGGSHGGIYAGPYAKCYITDTSLQRVYSKINNHVISGANGCSYFGYGSTTYLDRCSYYVDPYFGNNNSQAYITIKPGSSTYNNQTSLYISNLKIPRLRCDPYSNLYIGENVTNLTGDDYPEMFQPYGSGNIAYTTDNYYNFVYTETTLEELSDELMKCRKFLVGNSDKIAISGKYDKNLLAKANLRTVIEYLTSGGDNNVST